MHHIISRWAGWLSAILFLAGLSSCMKDKITKTYAVYTPVLKAKSAVLADIKGDQPVPIENAGKIYLYGNYIFLNELNKGVHIIDNSIPAAPVNRAFIAIPGNIDIAVKGSILYADMFTDLLAIDISNPLQIKLESVRNDIFPERRYANNLYVDSNMVVVDWTRKDTTVEIMDNSNPIPFCRVCLFATADASNKTATMGIAGSMARFSIVNNILYTVNNSMMHVFKLDAPAEPELVNTIYAGWNIETIYPFKDKLFLGSTGGMFMFDISHPYSPERLGVFTHANACDPVAANDSYAYVTLRGGNFCQSTVNQLDVIDITNVMQPKLVKTYNMTNPYGVAIDGNLVFICDGIDGLKVFDATDPSALKLIRHLKDMETYDVIAHNKKLLVVTKTALEQFEYSNINDIKSLSKLQKNR